MGFCNIFRRSRVADDEGEVDLAPESSTPVPSTADGMQRIKPVIRTYLYKDDVISRKRYILFFMTVVGAFIWWLGPVLGLFLVDPLVQLLLLDVQVITPTTNCMDHRLANQTCDSDVMVDYYFYNITNKDEWISGLAPPSYEEVGPYAFKAKEVRYNVQYNSNWTEVEYSYHQFAEFIPESSCPTCTMNASITGVNRGYLQFLAAPPSGPVDQESGVIYQLMPITLSVIRDSITAAIYSANPASTTLQQDVVAQWTDCSFLLPLMPFLGLSTPYLKDIPLPPGMPGFPFNPELCAYIPGAFEAVAGFPITPADFPGFGLAMDQTATATFLQLAIGQSNATYLDPAAGQFVGAFLTLPQATLLAAVATVSPPASAALSVLTPTQWLLLQGYLASLVPTWGSLVFTQWLEVGKGGMIATKPVEEWLYGFEDPLLLTAAQGAAAAAGTPEAYRLTPWLYKPSIALTFPTKEAPLEYFEEVTGQPYNYSMLSWNPTDVGFFNPLIQQKRMYTGKGQGGEAPQDMLQYRGLPFTNKTWGILNVTGINEAISFGLDVDVKEQKVTWDSVLSRAVDAQFSGYKADIKKVTMMMYNMTDKSTAPCNFTYYGLWAGLSGFDPESYQDSVNQIPKESYWELMRNNSALEEYLLESPMKNTLGSYYEQPDVYRDRCANPESFKGMWDMSSLLACPTIYTFPRFLGADDVVVNSTGSTLSTWEPDTLQHGYTVAVEPLTGIALHGHKTYQVNHLVSATPNLYPSLWTSPGTAAATGLASDFVTVPVYWIRMWWEPTDTFALIVRIALLVNAVLYYVLVMTWPVFGWAMLGSSLFILHFSKDGKKRRKALPEIQRSRARSLRLTRHEKEMIAGLSRMARGSIGVILPDSIPEGMSENSENAGDFSIGTAVDTIGTAAAAADSLSESMEQGESAQEGHMAWRLFERTTPRGHSRSPRVTPAPIVPDSGVGGGEADDAATAGPSSSLSSSSSNVVQKLKSGSSNSREQPLLVRSSTSGSGGSKGGAGGSSSTGSEAPLLLRTPSTSSPPPLPDAAAASSSSTSANKWVKMNTTKFS